MEYYISLHFFYSSSIILYIFQLAMYPNETFTNNDHNEYFIKFVLELMLSITIIINGQRYCINSYV